MTSRKAFPDHVEEPDCPLWTSHNGRVHSDGRRQRRLESWGGDVASRLPAQVLDTKVKHLPGGLRSAVGLERLPNGLDFRMSVPLQPDPGRPAWVWR